MHTGASMQDTDTITQDTRESTGTWRSASKAHIIAALDDVDDVVCGVLEWS
jgi:hypothetical protein